LQVSPADDAAGELQESVVNERQTLEADAQSPEVVKPRDGALDHPAGFAQTAAVGLAPPCDLSCDARGM
jgi:hypothetical protein